MKTAVTLSVVALLGMCLVAPAFAGNGHARIIGPGNVEYPFPFFTDAQTSPCDAGNNAAACTTGGGGIFTDANGGGWEAITMADFNPLTHSGTRGMQWDGTVWSNTNVAGDVLIPSEGTYTEGSVIRHPAATNQDSFPQITFIAPSAGTYSLAGTALITGQRTRVFGRTYEGATGDPVVNFASIYGNSVEPPLPGDVDLALDLTIVNSGGNAGNPNDLQNVSLGQGDRIALGLYTLMDEVNPNFPNVIPPNGRLVLPEPATMAIVGVGATLLMLRRRQRG